MPNQPDVVEALRELLAAYEAWASASLTADTAKKNYTDPLPDIYAECAAMVRCSNAEKAARTALALAAAPSTQQDERAAFEAWADANQFNIHRDDSDKYNDYHKATTRWAWQAWQARAALKDRT